jgi:hypothetical protein
LDNQTRKDKMMGETFKTRGEHRGQPAPHLGQDHYEKSQTDAAADRGSGPSFASRDSADEYHEQQQQPVDVTYRAQQAIEKGSEPSRQKPPKALKEAVEDLDDGLSVKPS